MSSKDRTFASSRSEATVAPLVSSGHSRDSARDSRSGQPRDARSEDRSDDHHRHHRRGRDRRRDGSSHRKRAKHSHSHNDSHSPPRHRRSHRQSPGPTARPESTAETANSLYVVDQRGDPLILRYGSNERSRVPVYRRLGRGKILGCRRGFLVLDRDGINEVFTIRTSGDGGSLISQKSSSLLRLITAKGRRTAPHAPVAAAAKPAAPGDFMPLGDSRKRNREDDDDDPSTSSDEDARPFRPIDLWQPSKAASDSGSVSGDDANDGENDDDTKKEHIALSRRVKEHPEDVDSWLRLIEVQDVRLHIGQDGLDSRSSNSGNASRGVADVKLSMFESALPHAKSEAAQERLLLGLMREGSRVWSPKTQAARWTAIADEHPESFRLWRAHLNHVMTDVASFKFETAKAFLVNRMKWLRVRLEERITSPEGDAADLADQLVYVLLRATRFLQDAGFGEVALATWQAMLELTFCRPPELVDAKSETCVSSFRSFWEGEAARFGEEGSRGWRQASEDDDVPEPKPPAAPALPISRDAYKEWAAQERRKSAQSSVPARTMDSGADDDPFRVVLISDMEDLLFAVPSAVLSHTKRRLVAALAHFCRLPPAFGPDGLPYSALNDPFLAGDEAQLGEEIHKQGTEEGKRQQLQSDEHPALSDKLPRFRHDQPRMAASMDVYFSGPDWFTYFPLEPGAPELQEAEGKLYWALNAVKQLVLKCGFEELAEYHLCLQWLRDPQGVRKTSKALLKNHYPTNTMLYRAYAAAESANGNNELACKVLASAAGQKLSHEVSETQALWNAAAWIELASLNKDKATACLGMSIGDESRSPDAALSPAALLRMRQTFQSGRDYRLSSGDAEAAAQFAESFALLEYLTNSECAEPRSENQGNISAAISSILAFSGDLCSRGALAKSATHERLLQFGAKLLYFHTKHGPYRPAFLREKLHRFVELFPQNTIFLSLFDWAEPSLRIDSPVRKLLQKTALVGPHDCVSTRIFAIRHELRAGNFYTARAAFEAALAGGGGGDKGPCAGDVRLWSFRGDTDAAAAANLAGPATLGGAGEALFTSSGARTRLFGDEAAGASIAVRGSGLMGMCPDRRVGREIMGYQDPTQEGGS
ncbi:hypothetical protein MAPG_06474 [Magnaporthiopsis poae ATCC 64411]|uniref:DUF1740-domain-containing protein n=1 Tax=Magnaporthiopsis poae (strain ATCC 64411 / 73-15) TaxID=644358 RepID=A0A0C4E246_MAGP6|nr:hypothetical protein MAPG_06474 [Magnaporthiopsis poae ATCC 64411]